MNRRQMLQAAGVAAATVFRSRSTQAQGPRWRPDGIGRVGRIGVLTPEFDPVPETEMSAMAPPGVSIHAARVKRSPTAAAFAEPPHVDNAVEQLAELAPSAIAFGWTSSSYALGVDADGPTRARLEQRAKGVPVVLPCPVAADALRLLGVKRLAVINPPWFSKDSSDKGGEYFRAKGFDVVSCVTVTPARSFTEVRPEEVFEFARANTPRGADALFIGGNGLRAVGTIEALEATLGKPVLTANQIVFWGALRAAKISASITGYGRIFGSR